MSVKLAPSEARSWGSAMFTTVTSRINMNVALVAIASVHQRVVSRGVGVIGAPGSESVGMTGVSLRQSRSWCPRSPAHGKLAHAVQHHLVAERELVDAAPELQPRHAREQAGEHGRQLDARQGQADALVQAVAERDVLIDRGA